MDKDDNNKPRLYTCSCTNMTSDFLYSSDMATRDAAPPLRPPVSPSPTPTPTPTVSPRCRRPRPVRHPPRTPKKSKRRCNFVETSTPHSLHPPSPTVARPRSLLRRPTPPRRGELPPPFVLCCDCLEIIRPVGTSLAVAASHSKAGPAK
jgi:hypothetical protein